MYSPKHPFLHSGNNKNDYAPVKNLSKPSGHAFLYSGDNGAAKITDSDVQKELILQNNQARLDRKFRIEANQEARERDWCRCLQCAALLGTATLLGSR